jgi:hypothetical protein
MQAIITRYHGPAGSRGARISAACAGGRISIDYPHDLSHDERHVAAADALCEKMAAGRPGDPWLAPRVCGTLPNGDVAHVFTTPA